jgi:hypothetical protein
MIVNAIKAVVNIAGGAPQVPHRLPGKLFSIKFTFSTLLLLTINGRIEKAHLR